MKKQKHLSLFWGAKFTDILSLRTKKVFKALNIITSFCAKIVFVNRGTAKGARK